MEKRKGSKEEQNTTHSDATLLLSQATYLQAKTQKSHILDPILSTPIIIPKKHLKFPFHIIFPNNQTLPKLTQEKTQAQTETTLNQQELII